jgi:hypothetical protein
MHQRSLRFWDRSKSCSDIAEGLAVWEVASDCGQIRLIEPGADFGKFRCRYVCGFGLRRFPLCDRGFGKVRSYRLLWGCLRSGFGLDPASVSSILAWGNFLQDRVDYLIVKNSLSNPADFGCWENDPAAIEFRRLAQPKIISMEYRLPEIEHEAREHGLTLQAVASRKTTVPALKSTASVWRAQAYRRHLFAELERVKDLLLL